jgi:peptidoglycan hydrolase CwlO-like protein
MDRPSDTDTLQEARDIADAARRLKERNQLLRERLEALQRNGARASGEPPLGNMSNDVP